MKKRKRFLITGHSRSGTGYAASLFSANGFDIGHERMGRDGTSSWLMAVEAISYPWTQDRRQDYEFDTVIHVVREPLDVVCSSAITEKPKSLAFRSKFVHIEGGMLEGAIRSYYGWTRIIQEQKPDMTVRVGELQSRMGFQNPARERNARPHRTVTRDELKDQVSAEAWDMFLWLEQFYNTL